MKTLERFVGAGQSVSDVLDKSLKCSWRGLAHLLGSAFMVLLVSMLVGCGAPAGGGNEGNTPETSSAAAQTQATPVIALPAPSPTPQAGVGQDGGAAGDTVATDRVAGPEPEIGNITFALDATAANEPVAPGFFFTSSITEVHAIFEYNYMSPDYVWDRVWYLNDRQVAQSSSLWNGPENGVFDYFIDNGGQPLPAGDWVLEIYVEGELRSLGVFIIDDAQ